MLKGIWDGSRPVQSASLRQGTLHMHRVRRFFRGATGILFRLPSQPVGQIWAQDNGHLTADVQGVAQTCHFRRILKVSSNFRPLKADGSLQGKLKQIGFSDSGTISRLHALSRGLRDLNFSCSCPSNPQPRSRQLGEAPTYLLCMISAQ